MKVFYQGRRAALWSVNQNLLKAAIRFFSVYLLVKIRNFTTVKVAVSGWK